jgi:hypothetical protein
MLPLAGVATGVIAAGNDAWSWLGYVGTVVAVLLGISRLAMRASEYDTSWYQARSTAEEIKSLAWRYAIAAAPFERGLDDRDADAVFITRLREITRDFSDLEAPSDRGEITPAMRALRAASTDDRVEAFLEHRVREQQRWYGARSRRAARAADRWDIAFYVLVAAAVVAGVLLAADDAAAVAVSVSAGAMGAVLAWVGVNRFAGLATAYARVATELSLLASVAPPGATEDWSRFVDGVEQAIAREHVEWRAARS